MSKKNDDGPDEVVRDVVTMSKQPIKISMELFPDGRLEMTGPFHSPVMFLGVLEVAKNLVHKQTSGNKPPQSIVVPKLKGMM